MSRRRFKFRVKGLFGLVFLLCLMASGIRHAVVRYREEQSAIQQLQDARLTVRVITRRSNVLSIVPERYGKVFDRVVSLSVAGRSPIEDIGLYADPKQFTDEHVDTVLLLKHLEQLDVSETSMTSKGFTKLAGLRHLTALNISGTQIDSEARQLFRAARPKCVLCSSYQLVYARICRGNRVFVEDTEISIRDAKPVLAQALVGPRSFGHNNITLAVAQDTAVDSDSQSAATILIAAAKELGYRNAIWDGAHYDLKQAKVLR